MFAKFGVDSSRRLSFRARTHVKTHRFAKSKTPLITLPVQVSTTARVAVYLLHLIQLRPTAEPETVWERS